MRYRSGALIAIVSAIVLSGCMHAGVPVRTGRVPHSGDWRIGVNITLPGLATGPGRHCARRSNHPRPAEARVGGPADDAPAQRQPIDRVARPRSAWARARHGCGVRSTARSTFIIILMMLPPNILLGLLDFEVAHTIGRTEAIAHLGINGLGGEVRHAIDESPGSATALEGAIMWRPTHAIPHTRVGLTYSAGATAGLTTGGHLSFGPEPHALLAGFDHAPLGAPLALRLTGVLAGHGVGEEVQVVGGIAPYLDYTLQVGEFDVGGHPVVHVGSNGL